MFNFLLRNPVSSLVFSFAVAIFVGALCLRLPGATTNGISFLDALFTATSAACVTGLSVLDTGTTFTVFGQTIIMVLVQLGGLGIMTAGAFMFLFFKRIGIGTGAGFKKIMVEEYISDARRAVKFIVISTFLIEAAGAALLFLAWQGIFSDTGKLAFNAVFHSVSAFCNAGFSPFPNNLESFKGDIFINSIFSSLIILGGIGFIVLDDFWKNTITFWKNLFSGRHRRLRLSLHTKIVLAATAIIIFSGTLMFYFFERENLSNLSQKELALSSFFQVITSRTAGFNTLNIGALTSPTLMLLMIIMTIGAAPASCAGGIKVTSLVLAIAATAAFLKSRVEIVLFGRTIPRIQARQIFVLSSLYLIFCLFIGLALLYTETGSYEKIMFEVFSAMGTVGLTAGITPLLTGIGKVLIIITMFAGRLLPLSIAIIGAKELIKSEIIYPEEKIILG